MRFAHHNNEKVEAAPGAEGVCPACSARLVPKCGTRRVWHWAHKGVRHCDHWWEAETEWHRTWKQHFPRDWQEVSATGQDGERHIADIKTPQGLVVEFQHSPIRDTERESREDFYGEMVWVLNASRLPRDNSTFFRHIRVKTRKRVQGVWATKFNPSVPSITGRWIRAQKPIFLDFGEDIMWRIPVEQDGWGKLAAEIAKSDFIADLLNDREPLKGFSAS